MEGFNASFLAACHTLYMLPSASGTRSLQARMLDLFVVS